MTGHIIPNVGREYDRIDGVNISSLLHIVKSPLHYQHNLSNPSESSSAMRIGTAIHCATLEPDRFAAQYCVVARMKAGQKRQEHELTEKQYEAAQAAGNAIRRDKLAMACLRGTENEIAGVWIDPETKVACKMRLDAINLERNILIDLKTARDPSPGAFCRQAANLSYHTRMAWYSDGLEVITGKRPHVMVIAVESAGANDVVCYDLPDDPVLDVGRNNYRELLKKLVWCRENNSWEGCGGGVTQLFALPKWALPDEDDLSEVGLEWDDK